jgi:Mechanosensitive ion channel
VYYYTLRSNACSCLQHGTAVCMAFWNGTAHTLQVIDTTVCLSHIRFWTRAWAAVLCAAAHTASVPLHDVRVPFHDWNVPSHVPLHALCTAWARVLQLTPRAAGVASGRTHPHTLYHSPVSHVRCMTLCSAYFCTARLHGVLQYGGEALEGRVERVGWYQTRLRGRDTRPTYIPNNVFVQNLVTNMDRISEYAVQFRWISSNVTRVG